MMMKKIAFTLLALTIVWLPSRGQAVRNQHEKATDKRQIDRGVNTIQRDNQEIQQFRGYKQKLDNALSQNMPEAAKVAHKGLKDAMEREIQQGQQKIQWAATEVGQSKAEVNSDNREINRNRRKKGPVKKMDDRMDKRDDRADLADDRDDLAELRKRNARQQEILNVFKSLEIKGNPNAMAALKTKRHLLDEFERTMIADMGENWEELSEDKKELQEDRRETREDRRDR